MGRRSKRLDWLDTIRPDKESSRKEKDTRLQPTAVDATHNEFENMPYRLFPDIMRWTVTFAMSICHYFMCTERNNIASVSP